MREEIVRARTAKGWPQRELAKALRISPTYVVEIEKGRKVPSVTLAERMARVLGLEREAMIRWAVEARLTGPARSLYAELRASKVDPKVEEAIKLVRNLPDQKREEALAFLRKLAQRRP